MPLTIKFQITAEPEDVEIEGNASAIDPKTDREQEEWIRKQLESGNEWAWCTAVCTATIELDGQTFTGREVLGCCSYESAEDFERCEGESMRKGAAEDLKATLDAAVARGKVAKHLREIIS